MKELVKRIIATKRCSAERMHTVENIIDTELSFHDIHFEDMYPEDLRRIKDDLCEANCEELTEICEELTKMCLEDLFDLINALSDE